MLSLRPSLKDAIWGGLRLFERYRKGSGERLAESWELSTHADGHSRLPDGRTLQDRLATEPWLAGGSAHRDGTIPILAKLIDARLPLSVQVHPTMTVRSAMADYRERRSAGIFLTRSPVLGFTTVFANH